MSEGPRYEYDMEVLESAVQEIAEQLEASDDDEVGVEVKIDSEGSLHIGDVVLKNQSQAAKQSRIRHLREGLMNVVRSVISQANSKSEKEDDS